MPEIELAGLHAGTVTVEGGALGHMQIRGPLAVIVDAGLPERWRAAAARLSPLVTVEVPARDECKTIGVLEGVLSRLARSGLTRDGAVLGLGGGATTDLAGFAAACYLRGVRYYSAPTTLLGMVDAAVGGKTGVNLPEGKNLVGAFWPARRVWCDPQVLETLPGAVFREGAAEAYKHGLISDPSLLTRVLSPDFAPNHPAFADTLADAIRVKAGVVTRDPTEQGERAFLNFGHTLAHAIEGATHGGTPHGFAVGYGMHYAALLSHALGGADLTGHTRRFLAWQRPSPLPPLDWAELSDYMARDKKADSAGVRFVLLRDLAQPYLARVPEELLHVTFGSWRADMAELGLSAAVLT